MNLLEMIKKHIHGLLIIYDILTIYLSYLLALLLRFDCKYSSIPSEHLDGFHISILILIIISIALHSVFKLYDSVWRFASYKELKEIMISNSIIFVVNILLTVLFFTRMPISYYVFGIILQIGFCMFSRFFYRFYLLVTKENHKKHEDLKNVMIIGAGESGNVILRDIQTNKENEEKVVCIIDDNSNKIGRYVSGVKVVGDRFTIKDNVKKYNVEKIYVCIPTAKSEDTKEILTICKETKCQVLKLPGIYQLANGDVSIRDMKPVAIEDLLGRDPIVIDTKSVLENIEGKVVLVTGGGGSIGSELCRQIASHNPKQLIIVDVYENNAYDIQQELIRKYGDKLNLEVIICSVRDSRKIYSVFKKYKPEIVYHAAAHKHVPLMETVPCEAIKNNCIGTYKTAYAALANGTKRFVLISTDKAVNPTNIMGASKRICEMIIQTFGRMVKENRQAEIPQLFTHLDEQGLMSKRVKESKCEFVAVRFGNVLGSNGSVIPLFKKQIENGGPVTVTDKNIIRYFMTIPEAVSLVLEAGFKAKSGEIFVLDMGKPVKIDNLARNLITLSGFKPDVDIKIEYTGLRPGEKLYEEKLMSEEGLQSTDNNLIHIAKPLKIDETLFLSQLQELMDKAYKNNNEEMIDYVKEVVSTYHPQTQK